jgi:hypothetical protein
MNTRRFTGALAALVLAGALVSCAADAEPQAFGKREGKGKAAHAKRVHQKSGHHHRAAAPGHARPGKTRSAGPGSTVAAPAGSTGTHQAGSQSAGQPAARPSCTDDPSGDTDSSGSAPAYVDVSGGCLRPEGSQLRLEARAGAPVPARMPDRNTQLSYGFELTRPDGSTIYVHAQADPQGWTAYLSRGQGRSQIAPPTVADERLTLSLPLAELGAARSFQWALESSWLKSGLISTSYAFDGSPNGGTARFDR